MSTKKRKTSSFALALALAAVGLGAAHATAQGTTPEQRSAIAIAAEYRIVPNVVYGVADDFETRVDLYLPRGRQEPVPTLIQIHGGGWVGGTKEGNALRLLPWLEMGWAVVNVQYRLGQVALAPAAVEDCLCALRWVIRNAEEYGFDTERIVVTGYSAGGHLALTTGIMPASAGLDRRCPGAEPLRVAAIVNWYGITDVNDLLEGANTRSYAVQWLGSLPDR
ncbi:MAG TPA: alpha/beta hydrolase, partial [Longimicrobiales bacterium]|nr:alpha/beta hydrolase [Longimicrobiales bacterium]